MPSITVHPPQKQPSTTTDLSNPLPQLLQTPSGLAVVEVQGTFNIPSAPSSSPSSPNPNTSNSDTTNTKSTTIGRLVFPLYDAENRDEADTKWMKLVYLYIGKHQRMTGEVKKLAKPLAVLRRREGGAAGDGEGQAEGGAKTGSGSGNGQVKEELEIVEIVRFKILFASRPEPVGVEEVT